MFSLINLFFAFLMFYILLESEMDKAGTVINVVGITLNILVVIAHLK